MNETIRKIWWYPLTLIPGIAFLIIGFMLDSRKAKAKKWLWV